MTPIVASLLEMLKDGVSVLLRLILVMHGYLKRAGPAFLSLL